MPKLTNKKKLNEFSELYLGNFNARLSNFLMREVYRFHFLFGGGGTFAGGQLQPHLPLIMPCHSMLKLCGQGHIYHHRGNWYGIPFISWDEILTAVQRET